MHPNVHHEPPRTPKMTPRGLNSPRQARITGQGAMLRRFWSCFKALRGAPGTLLARLWEILPAPRILKMTSRELSFGDQARIIGQGPILKASGGTPRSARNASWLSFSPLNTILERPSSTFNVNLAANQVFADF